MYKKYVKRIIDILVSAIALVVFSPICVLMSILIKVIDKNPILFTQDRTGLHGKSFKIYKFSTMKNGQTTRIRQVFQSNIA